MGMTCISVTGRKTVASAPAGWQVSRLQTPGKRTRGLGPLGCMQLRPFEPFHLLPLAYWRRFLLTGGGE